MLVCASKEMTVPVVLAVHFFLRLLDSIPTEIITKVKIAPTRKINNPTIFGLAVVDVFVVFIKITPFLFCGGWGQTPQL